MSIFRQFHKLWIGCLIGNLILVAILILMIVISVKENFSFDRTNDDGSDWIDKIKPENIFNHTRTELEKLFSAIEKEIALADQSLINSTKAEHQKTIKGIDHLEEKWNRALKKRNEVSINQINKIHLQVFPENTFQERHDSLWSYIIRYGIEILDNWLENSNPFNDELTILREQPKTE